MINNITHINDNEPRYSDGDIYYYHGDHLGSATWITDATGAPVQYLQYLPTGEIWQNQMTGNYNERFKFTGKEHDEAQNFISQETINTIVESNGFHQNQSIWKKIFSFLGKWVSINYTIR